MIDITLNLNAKDLICLPDTFFVKNLEIGERKTASGIYIPEENMKLNQRFIKPRWCQVFKKANNITDFEVGDWLLMKHGHWSTAINVILDGKEEKIWYITPKNRKRGIMALAKNMPQQLIDYVSA